jgi:hypothetical protein
MAARSLIRQEQLRLTASFDVAFEHIWHVPPPYFYESMTSGHLIIHCPYGEAWLYSNPPDTSYIPLGGAPFGWAVYAYAFEDGVVDPGTYGYDHHEEACGTTGTKRFPLTGTIEIIADVDVCYVREAVPDELLADDPEDTSDPPRKLEWPAFGDGGLSVWDPDYPTAAQHRVARFTRPGGSITTTITATDGTNTTTATMTITIVDHNEIGPATIAASGALYGSLMTATLHVTDINQEHGGEVDGSPADWYPFDVPSISYSRSSGGNTVTMTGDSITVVSANSVLYDLSVTPNKKLACVGALRRYADDIEGTWDIHTVKRAGYGTETISGGSSWDGGVTQIGGHGAGCTLNGVAQPGDSAACEYTPVRYWVSEASLSSYDEDSHAWRILIHTKPFDAMQIEQVESLNVDDGTILAPVSDYFSGFWDSADATLSVDDGIKAVMGGAAGEVVRSFTPLRGGMSGYRYLAFTVKMASGTGTFKVGLGTKEWERDFEGNALTATTTATTFIIDLCGETNMTGVIDNMETRFGPDWDGTDDAETGWVMPTEDDSVADPGCMWGVQGATEILFTLEASKTYHFQSIDLRRLIPVEDDPATHSYSLLNLLAGFRQWRLFSDDTVTGGGGDIRTRTYLQVGIIGNTDGRYSMEDAVGEIVIVDPPSGITTTTYVELTIADVLAKVNADDESWPVDGVETHDLRLRNAGWTAGYEGGVDTADGVEWSNWLNGDLNRQRPATWLGGAGGVYAPVTVGAMPAWTWFIDNPRRAVSPDVAHAISAQALCDVFDCDAGIGDVFGLTAASDPLAGDTTIAALRIFRGRAWGIVLNTDETANVGVNVTATEALIDRGLGLTDTQGQYRTLAPYGHGRRDHTIDAQVGTLPYPEATARFYDRWPARRCFRVGVVTGKYVWLLRDYHGRRYVATCADGDALTVIEYDDNDARRCVWTIDAGPGCTHPELHLSTNYQEVSYLKSGHGYIKRSADHGRSWSVAVDLGGTYDALTTCDHQNRKVVLGYKSAQWYCRVGKKGNDGTYTMGAEVSLALSSASDSGHVSARRDGAIEFVYLDTSGSVHVITGHGIALNGTGTWKA